VDNITKLDAIQAVFEFETPEQFLSEIGVHFAMMEKGARMSRIPQTPGRYKLALYQVGEVTKKRLSND
jgi:hypothetical protein